MMHRRAAELRNRLGPRTRPDESIRQPRNDERAICRSLPTRWWFTDGVEAVDAYVACMSCRARFSCLAFALDHPGLTGIWAGTTKSERAQIRRQRSR
jgi:hypothetical protein